MSEQALAQLADAAGLLRHWRDYRDRPCEVPAQTLQRMLAALGLPADGEAQARDTLARLREEQASAVPPLLVASAGEPLALPACLRGSTAHIELEDGDSLACAIDEQRLLPPIAQIGYHRLGVGDTQLTLAVAPRAAVPARGRDGRRAFGLAAQAYSLRRPGDAGIGDFTALAQLAIAAGSAGADALAVSPVHALFAADLHHYSPYSPSSRLFVNVLHIDPEAEFGEVAARVAERLQLDGERVWLAQQSLIDWPAGGALKLRWLRALWDELREALRGTAGRAFQAFVAAGGTALRDHARFEALHAAQLAQDASRWHWRGWGEGLDDPRSAAVERWAAAHADEVDFHLFLQWLADRGLASAQAAARHAGMSLGLIADLAVGTSNGGSYAWSQREALLEGVAVGAPPDDLNALGQNWGLTALSPRALTQLGYAPFIETLRANLRHAGGLRIDHVLGLRRLWLIPDGVEGGQGVYLRLPFEDLLRLTALESARHGAAIIGEDLGTVPEGFRPLLADAGVLGIRVMYFERDHGFFVDPSRYSDAAMATTSTHDVAPVAAWWKARDLDWRSQLNQFGVDADEAGEREARARDRETLWAAFRHAGTAHGEAPPTDAPQPAVDAALDFIAATPAPLAMFPLEDLLGVDEQPNLPGTIAEHPNWRRRLPGEAATLLDAAPIRERLNRIRMRRS